MKLEVYLYFEGNCREAMEFYKTVFGGELQITDADPDQWGDAPNKEWFKGKVMHSTLDNGEISLTASDGPKASPEMKKVSLTLIGTDEPKMRKVFDRLSNGGKVRQPLAKMSWGDTFGSVMDRYGVEWAMNIGPAGQN